MDNVFFVEAFGVVRRWEVEGVMLFFFFSSDCSVVRLRSLFHTTVGLL